MARPDPEVIQLGPTANDVSFSVSAAQAAYRASATAAVVGVAVNFEYPILFWTARDVRSPRSPTSAARWGPELEPLCCLILFSGILMYREIAWLATSAIQKNCPR